MVSGKQPGRRRECAFGRYAAVEALNPTSVLAAVGPCQEIHPRAR